MSQTEETVPIFYIYSQQQASDHYLVIYLVCEDLTIPKNTQKLEMWANAQRDGCPAEHRWRPLLNSAKFG